MDFFKTVELRRSVRSFTDEPVEPEDLDRIVNAGRIAPSGCNIQPIEFVTITSRETLDELGKMGSFAGEAQAAVAIVADAAASRYWIEDASAAAENMLLAVTALGYASCWIQGGLERIEEAVKELLGVPFEKRLIILLPIGSATSPGAMAEKRSFDDCVHRERYGG